ncbi:long-chain fatty acid--CoA ligase [Actinoplanes sp. NPDC051513]|uniref:long-chain fatty acid--CoA ligase n=1 Tax=Actinoplanes sp. NPDC051513 TaxID=3363908 RepID=UPI003797ADEE
MQDRALDVAMLVRRAEGVFGHKRVVTATATGEGAATWGEVVARARRLAGVLDLLGVPPGARVGTFGWNSQRHLELYLAVPSSGRVLHTLNHRLFAAELTYIVADAADDVLFVDRSLLPTVWPLMADLHTVRHVVVMDDGGDEPIPGDSRVFDYDALLARVREPVAAAVVAEDDAASLCYTSGTTGRPKGVLSSQRSIVLHTLVLLGADAFAISERDVVMPIVPMFHVNAWGLPYAAAMAGADLVLPGPRMTPDALASLLTRHRVTFTAAVPAIWRALEPLLPGLDLSALRMAVSGGSALPISLSQAYDDVAGVTLSSSWGMTETSPLVTCARPASTQDGLDAAARREILCSPGRSVPLTELRLLDADGHIVPHDGATPGEVQVSGPTIANGYFGAGAGQESITDDGWLRTGDIGTIDADGCLRIVDRTKDLVKSGGEWISSVTLENAIMAHPDVLEAAVVAVPDRRWGERPLACVVVAPGRSLAAEDLRAHLAGRVASWWVPDEFRFMPEIPKTATGKFAKVALRRQVADPAGPLI